MAQIISGCERIVVDQENKLYKRSFRLNKTSNTDLCLHSIYDNLSLLDEGDVDNFRQGDVKKWLPEDIRVPSRIIHRNLMRLLKNNYIQRKYSTKNKITKHPGRPEEHMNQINASNVNRSYTSYSYSKSDYLLSLEKLVLEIVPRYIIYTRLRNSGYLERFLKICEYKKLLVIRSTEPTEILRRLKSHTKSIGLIPESAFKEAQYMKEQKTLLQLKGKKSLKMIASKKAKLLIQNLEWNDRIYTRFFQAGGYINLISSSV